MGEYIEFVECSLELKHSSELRDINTLFDELKDSLISMYSGTTISPNIKDDALYAAIEYVLIVKYHVTPNFK